MKGERKRREKKLYLKVTQDRYALPLMVCDSVGELAEASGVRKESMSTMLSLSKRRAYPQYIAVVIEPEEEEKGGNRNEYEGLPEGAQ